MLNWKLKQKANATTSKKKKSKLSTKTNQLFETRIRLCRGEQNNLEYTEIDNSLRKSIKEEETWKRRSNKSSTTKKHVSGKKIVENKYKWYKKRNRRNRKRTKKDANSVEQYYKKLYEQKQIAPNSKKQDLKLKITNM